MAPSAIPFEGFSAVEIHEELRPVKKIRLEESRSVEPLYEQDDEEEDFVTSISSHPLNIKPSGNAYTSSTNAKDSAGAFARLPDELIIQLLEYLDASELIGLGATCKALYAFTRAEDLWKALFIESRPPNFTWEGTWRSTHLRLPASKISQISCSNLFSDVLYRPFQCAFTPLEPYTRNIPRENLIPRLKDLSHKEYSACWLDQPFILTSPVKDWPIYNQWTSDSLEKRYGNVAFRAEAVDWPLSTYLSYMQNNNDESPLYLFDRSFADKMNLVTDISSSTADYVPPSCFGEDLFGVLGAQRPDCRWLIMGPARSGSTFHKDPNGTSAWNAVITGSKYWLMFPPSVSVPGVIVSPDGSEITSPLSIAEYLLTFHALARETPGCKEGVCYPGEVLHVPSGWFHLVLNLEEGIAVTQNFVSRGRLVDVMLFLRDTPYNISGFKDEVENPYELFVERLREQMPDVLEEALATIERKDKKGRRGNWEELTKDEGGFSFGFGGDEDEEVP